MSPPYHANYSRYIFFVARLIHRLYLNKSASTPQIQYQIIFCLWLLTFEKDIAAQINE